MAIVRASANRHPRAHPVVEAATAMELIQAGSAPAGLHVTDALTFAGHAGLVELPRGLTVKVLDLSGCTGLKRLPEDLHVQRLSLSGAWNPEYLLSGLKCYDLDLKNTGVTSLPSNLEVEYRLDLEGCTALRSLPQGLKVGSLVLRGCISVESLPEGLDVYFLDISGCTAIKDWPQQANIGVGRLTARGCAQLRALPTWLTSLAQLDVRDCTNLRHLPEGLIVTSWIDVAGTHIRSVPDSMRGVQLRWRGVAVDARIAFSPELITAEEILAEPNAERRRVLLERMGYDTFLEHAQAETIDQDRDAGGMRRLLRVKMNNDEDLVCVTVLCPSTGRQYVLRVPPTVTTCHAAAAWVAGFDNANEYQPIIET